jgi:putative transposase
MFIAAERAGCAIHAYVMMSNHVHVLLTPSREDSATRMMQRLGAIYVRCFNDRHSRTGTLWEGRFHSVVIDSETYFFACSRYIELNPLRARMVDDPGLFAWSSYRNNALGQPERGLTPHSLYQHLGASARERTEAYKAMFAERIPESTLELLRRGRVAGQGGDRKSQGFRTAAKSKGQSP